MPPAQTSETMAGSPEVRHKSPQQPPPTDAGPPLHGTQTARSAE